MAVAKAKKKRAASQVKAPQLRSAVTGGAISGAAVQGAAVGARGGRQAIVKKVGKAATLTKKQLTADLNNLKKARAALAAARSAAKKTAGGRAVPPKTRAAVAPQELLEWPVSRWPTGCNDIAPTCAAVAVASHLCYATGIAVPELSILQLHAMAGGDSGATIEGVLEAAREHWDIFGVRLLSFFRADEQLLMSGLVVGTDLGHARHTVLSVPDGMISWGQYLPWDGVPEEAWALEWGF